ncbi:Light-regulated protein 1, chloroplastic [Sesamum angolense]|uniref:Light-regulated protein 1, chloroplastic n=1 Tax=Sesamum angolense TaxID=2727404 RepID=A0AAE2BPH0_9LAMI|nr:Light-regulated protein 1, chloroplastic [Sesamum angolense]
MQTALTLSSSPLVPCAPPRKLITSSPPNPSRFASVRSNALAVNYSSTISVFPAEACETIGGDTCLADMYPEVKLEAEAKKPKTASEAVEREYLDYTDPRTVLLGEACNVLGGEFCDRPYQTGIC